MVDISIAEVWIGLSDEVCSLVMCNGVSIRLLAEIPLKREVRIFDPSWK